MRRSPVRVRPQAPCKPAFSKEMAGFFVLFDALKIFYMESWCLLGVYDSQNRVFSMKGTPVFLCLFLFGWVEHIFQHSGCRGVCGLYGMGVYPAGRCGAGMAEPVSYGSDRHTACNL